MPGMIDRIIITTDQNAHPWIPTIQNASPARPPCTTPMTRVPLIVARLIARFLKAHKKEERRLELPTLKRILPLFLVYLLLLVIWPTTSPIGAWLFNIDFQELVFNKKIVFTFRFIEFIAAFTLLGYMIAEMRGRKNESVGKTLGWIFFTTLIVSIIIEIIRGYPPLIRSSILEIVIITAAALYGGVIYRLQLAAI